MFWDLTQTGESHRRCSAEPVASSMHSVAVFSQEIGLLDGARAAAVTLGLHLDEGFDQVPIVHPKQVGEGRLLDLQ